MDPDRLLRTGARMNATLSLLTGALLTITPTAVSNQLGLGISPWLRALGIALLAHAGMLEWAARRSEVRQWVRLNVAIIAPYPLAMFALAAAIIEPTSGTALVVVDGALVAVVAGVQWAGLRRHGRAPATLAA